MIWFAVALSGSAESTAAAIEHGPVLCIPGHRCLQGNPAWESWTCGWLSGPHSRPIAPNGKVAYDHFHICQHLGKAIDLVRRAEYKRVDGAKRRFIKGQRYHLLSNRENLDAKGRLELEALLKVNNRLNKAYLLKESFDQLWSYKSPAWARKFFDGWKKSLRWQRLKPLEKFAAMVDKHWDGIVARMGMKEKIPMGFVEGMNNKIRTIQRRA